MADFPSVAPPQLPVISTPSRESLGVFCSFSSNVSSATAPSARPTFIPVTLNYPMTVAQMLILNGTTVSGTIDLGVYTRSGRLIVSSGAVTQTGTSVVQAVDVTDTLLVPDVYYMAVAFSSPASTTVFQWITFIDAAVVRASGVRFTSTTLTTLPSTATFASNKFSTNIPWIGMTSRTSF